MDPDLTVAVRRAEFAEAEMLTGVMRRAFEEAFAHNTAPEDLKAYMDSNFTFYRRWGFRPCGTVPFIVGSDRQTDYILTRPSGLDRHNSPAPSHQQHRKRKNEPCPPNRSRPDCQL